MGLVRQTLQAVPNVLEVHCNPNRSIMPLPEEERLLVGIRY